MFTFFSSKQRESTVITFIQWNCSLPKLTLTKVVKVNPEWINYFSQNYSNLFEILKGIQKMKIDAMDNTK